MKKLIVNGDDFGLTGGVNRGIVRAFREGILTSTTIMANGPAFDAAAELARANPGLGVGCHLVLVGGNAIAPAAEIPTLADEQGRLPATLGKLVAKLACRAVRTENIQREIRAQIERVHAAGITPTHLDTHKHTHILPQVFEALARVAKEFGIKRVRKPFDNLRNVLGVPHNGDSPSVARRTWVAAALAGTPRFRALATKHGLLLPDHFFGLALTGRLGGASVVRILEGLPEGTSELMCHPGLYDEELERSATRLKRHREVELGGLVDPAARRAVEERGIQLINYAELN